MTQGVEAIVHAPQNFITMPWKNGLGSTIELIAMHEKGSNEFLWRLSIADVCNDGAFSNFSGYDRILTLLSGQGITLDYQGDEKRPQKQDVLSQIFSKAHFDGATTTFANLHNGPIQDFNVMTKKGVVTAQVQNYTDAKAQNIGFTGNHCFVYAHLDSVSVVDSLGHKTLLSEGHLLEFRELYNEQLSLSGRAIMTIQISFL